MTTEEHLAAIVAKCRELLATSEKRTAGKWHETTTPYQQPGYPFAIINFKPHDQFNAVISAHIRTENDATYIAACAGPAEAGWRATIVACELASILFIASPENDNSKNLSGQLIASWPKELL